MITKLFPLVFLIQTIPGPSNQCSVFYGNCDGVLGHYCVTDWDLYMLKLVNRARQDPIGEASRIGSTVTDSHLPSQPLSYNLVVGSAATNHNNWMQNNFGSISSGRIPDSFSHFETLDGQSSGIPATNTLDYTGALPGERITLAGYPWNTYGENILTNYSSSGIPITANRINISHKSWWESSGHRANMLNSNFAVFGFHIETRSFMPPRDGLNSPFRSIMFATQDFARFISVPRTYILGVLYNDKNNDESWTPQELDSSMHEGLANITLHVTAANNPVVVIAIEKTMSNGAFSVKIGSGTYDIIFFAPNNQLIVRNNIVLIDKNIDVGDVKVD